MLQLGLYLTFLAMHQTPGIPRGDLPKRRQGDRTKSTKVRAIWAKRATDLHVCLSLFVGSAFLLKRSSNLAPDMSNNCMRCTEHEIETSCACPVLSQPLGTLFYPELWMHWLMPNSGGFVLSQTLDALH